MTGGGLMGGLKSRAGIVGLVAGCSYALMNTGIVTLAVVGHNANFAAADGASMRGGDMATQGYPDDHAPVESSVPRGIEGGDDGRGTASQMAGGDGGSRRLGGQRSRSQSPSMSPSQANMSVSSRRVGSASRAISSSTMRKQKRKRNIIIFSVIAVVLALIVVVGGVLIYKNRSKKSTKPAAGTEEEKKKKEEEEKKKKDEEEKKKKEEDAKAIELKKQTTKEKSVKGTTEEPKDGASKTDGQVVKTQADLEKEKLAAEQKKLQGGGQGPVQGGGSTTTKELTEQEKEAARQTELAKAKEEEDRQNKLRLGEKAAKDLEELNAKLEVLRGKAKETTDRERAAEYDARVKENWQLAEEQVRNQNEGFGDDQVKEELKKMEDDVYATSQAEMEKSCPQDQMYNQFYAELLKENKLQDPGFVVNA